MCVCGGGGWGGVNAGTLVNISIVSHAGSQWKEGKLRWALPADMGYDCFVHYLGAICTIPLRYMYTMVHKEEYTLTWHLMSCEISHVFRLECWALMARSGRASQCSGVLIFIIVQKILVKLNTNILPWTDINILNKIFYKLKISRYSARKTGGHCYIIRGRTHSFSRLFLLHHVHRQHNGAFNPRQKSWSRNQPLRNIA